MNSDSHIWVASFMLGITVAMIVTCVTVGITITDYNKTLCQKMSKNVNDYVQCTSNDFYQNLQRVNMEK